ncbi:MAG: YlbF family regulator [Clostridia bacterium]|nr:YlbF family regulator [Clostridia bacterium]MBQ6937684.1 YlbF family regulator [Clostridia bacterium]MBR2884198.1 YlbF family regulator [Clostridia bacterium]
MAEIFEKARELGEAIIESKEYKELKEAELRQEQDEEALTLLKEYSDVRSRLAQEIQKGDVDDSRIAEIREELEEAYEKMTTNDSITAYINAQRTFQAIIEQMNNILSFHITGKMPGGCSGNCSSCGGDCK